MPGFDATGPEGLGPKTGRGEGPCPTGSGTPIGFTPRRGRNLGTGRGQGRGRGRGRGSGFGRWLRLLLQDRD